MAFFDDLKNKYLDILKPVTQTLGNVGQQVQQFTQPARDLANRGGLIQQVAPQVPQFMNQNFSSTQGRFNPIAQVKAVTQMSQPQALQYRQQVEQTVPRLNVAQNIQNPYYRILGEIGQGIVNTPLNAIAGAAKLPAARNFQQGASDIASIAEAPLSLTGFGVGKQIAKEGIKQVFKQGVKQSIKQGAKTGAIYGGVFGGLEGLREGEYNSVLAQLGKAALGTGTGAVFGGVTGGVLSGVGAILKKYIFKSSGVEKQLRDAEGKWIAGERPVKPKGMTQPAWDFQLKFNAKHERNPYTPVYVSDLSRELPQPGLSIKYTKGLEGGGGIKAKNKFYAAISDANGNLGSFKEVPNAKSVQISPNLDTFIHKNVDPGKTGWVVTEAKTGTVISRAFKTQAEAIQNAKENIIKVPKNTGQSIEQIIQDKITKQGISPRYNQVSSPLEGGVKIPKNIVKPIEQIQKEVQQVAGNIPKNLKANLSKPQTPVLGGSGISGGGSGKSLQNQSSKYSYNINKNRLQLNPQEKQTLDTVVNAVKPELQNIKGKTLSNDEVIKAAKTSDILQKVTNREETLAAEAATLKARQRLVELDKNINQLAKGGNTPQLQAQMKDLIDSLRVVSANAADTGRKLQSLSIEAGDESIRMQVLKDVARTSNNTDEILKAAQAVNWEDANSITKFYRQFIKPTTMEVLDEFRYNNMLSNPKTHIRNNFSNIIQTFITRPATLAAEGRPIEAVKYLGGAVKGFPEAIQAFRNSFSGKVAMTKPDLEQIATGKLPKFLTIPTRLMEASDKFFSALIKGGEIARGKTPEQAAKMAEYSLFRQGLKPEGQGTVLNAIDGVTAWTYNAPKAVRWFVPFIRTPMNFAKQWIEYSPAGITTLKGAGNKREQLAKTILGTMVTAVGANLAIQDKTTWAAPSDPKEKELFYAAGKKPFSILIGDKWVPMMYAGPFAFALALPAASKFYQEDNRTALTDDGITKLTKTASSMAQFISGQTFLEGIGNFVKFATGDADYSIGSNLAFTAGQVVPMQGLLRYISTIMDPIYRKPKGFGESFIKDIPGFSQNLQPYTEPTGEPSTRLPVNYVTPYDVGQRKQQYEQGLQERQNKLQENAVINQATKQVEVTKTPQEIAGNYIYFDPETQSAKKISLNLTVPKPELTGLAELDKQKISSYNSKVTATIKRIATLADVGYFTSTEAEAKIAELKQTQEKAAKTIKVKTAKPKKPKKISFKGVKAIKLKIPKAKTIKVKVVKPKKIKVYKVKKTRKLSTKVKKIRLT